MSDQLERLADLLADDAAGDPSPFVGCDEARRAARAELARLRERIAEAEGITPRAAHARLTALIQTRDLGTVTAYVAQLGAPEVSP